MDGRWGYLYRARDRDGNLIDTMPGGTRDMATAKRFFTQAVDTVRHVPKRVTTDGHYAYPRAVGETPSEDVSHPTNRYLNNRLEQDHRGLKQALLPHAWIRLL